MQLLSKTFGLLDARESLLHSISRKLLKVYYDPGTKLALLGSVTIVTVSTNQVGKQVQIQVSDNGTGMSAAVQAKIFQPFFTTKPTGEGTGLGLSLSHDIIAKGHGGTLSVASVPGESTEFIISLPA